MEEDCLFCLEPVKKDNVVNAFGCTCKICAHKQCLDEWFAQKQQFECPICHCVVITNPMMMQQIQILYVEAQENRRARRRGERCVSFCCLGIFLWILIITAIRQVYIGN